MKPFGRSLVLALPGWLALAATAAAQPATRPPVPGPAGLGPLFSRPSGVHRVLTVGRAPWQPLPVMPEALPPVLYRPLPAMPAPPPPPVYQPVQAVQPMPMPPER